MNNNPVNPFSQLNISAHLDENHGCLRSQFTSADIIFREFTIGSSIKIRGLLVFVDGLVDKKTIQNDILHPLMHLPVVQSTIQSVHEQITLQGLYASTVTQEGQFEPAIDLMLRGHTILLIDGIAICYVIDSQSWKMRNVSEPVSETVIRGPREGFVETLRVNTSMLRRKIAHPALTIEEFEIGKITRTRVALSYIEGLPPESLVQEVKRRLQKIDLPKVLESNYIEECIEDVPYSIFPTVGNSEKPDVVAARLLEGRIAIMVDGTSSALIVPLMFFDMLKMSEDYASRPLYASFIRFLRFFCVILSILGPAAYLAAYDFQQELIPTHLFISFLISRNDTPLKLFFELILLLLVFEILKEVGIRMPRPLSSSIPLIGGIILGETAVRAGFAAESSIIVVAIAGFCAVLIPILDQVNTILRFFCLILANYLGMFGLSLFVIFILIHLASIKSFGYFYMSPYFPVSWIGWRDFLLRLPHTILRKGPQLLTRTKSMYEDEHTHQVPLHAELKDVNIHEEKSTPSPHHLYRHVMWQWLHRKKP